MVQEEPPTPDSPHQAAQPPENSVSRPRFHHPQRNHDRRKKGQEYYHRNNNSQPLPDKAEELKDKEPGSDDEDETGPERPSQAQRHHRGGRPEKRIIEESAYDPYCE